jgi:hypothetical protein
MTVGSIISGGFGLLRERPGAVAIWGLIYLLTTVLLGLAMRPVMAAFAGVGVDNPEAVAELASGMGRLLLLEFAMFVVFVVLMTAAQRAVLQPERGRFAYLRFGMDELRMMGLGLFLIVLFYLGMVVATILLTLIAGVAAVTVGAVAAIPLMIIGIMAMFAVIMWLQVRICLAFPLTLMRGTIVIGEAWRSTRGRFWTLFGAFLLISLMLLVLWIAVALVSSGSYFSDLAQSGFTPEGMQAAGQRQMERQFGSITPLAILGWVVTAAAGTISFAVYGGALATAARESVADADSLSDTFA